MKRVSHGNHRRERQEIRAALFFRVAPCLRINRSAYRVEQRQACGKRFAREVRHRPGTVDRDHQPPRRVDVNLLTVNSKGIERAIVPRPPLVTIATSQLADVDLLVRRGFDPAVKP